MAIKTFQCALRSAENAGLCFGSLKGINCTYVTEDKNRRSWCPCRGHKGASCITTPLPVSMQGLGAVRVSMALYVLQTCKPV
jgi:hypothetical protein